MNCFTCEVCAVIAADCAPACLGTESTNPSLGAPVTSTSDSTLGVERLIGTVSAVGTSIASIITGRPIVSTKVNGQQVATLGNKPLVVGQVQANTVLLVLGGVVLAFLLLRK